MRISFQSSALTLAIIILAGCGGHQAGNAFVPPAAAPPDTTPQGNADGNVVPDAGGSGLVEFPTPWKQGLTYIASDGNGNEWTGVSNPSRMVRINEGSGFITDFAIPGEDAAPYGVALGRNRNGMWFTQPASNRLGYIRFSDNKFRLFTLSGPQVGLRGITAGPDNAMRFAESRAEKIGRISVNGFGITAYSVAPCDAQMITAGGDGALWFTSNCGIGRITTGGQISTFQLGGLRVALGITTGPDGAIWYTGITHDAGSFVGRIDLKSHKRAIYNLFSGDQGTWDIATRGRYLYMTNPWNTAKPYIDHFNIDTHAIARGTLPFKYEKPYGIVLGTDGQLWFTNKIIPTISEIAFGKLCPGLTHRQCQSA